MLQENMQFILKYYNQTRGSQPGIDKSSSVYEIIEKKLPFYISGLLKDEKYIVDGSVGVGRWAEVPWIGIFNKNITTSAQKGFYICYLFGNDMESVYLTIIHSITKETGGKSWGKDQIKSFVQKKRRNLKAHIPNLNIIVENNVIIDDPTTLARSARAQKYSESTIAYKEYSKDSLPSEESLINDLRLFIELYQCMNRAENSAGNVTEIVQVEKQSELNKREEHYDLNYDKTEIVTNIIQNTGSELIPHIQKYITSKGFNYSLANIKNLYLSLRSKPFVIISGISGTGKTKIVQLFAESIGATEDNGQFTLIPVRPDWSDGSELLGYTDIKGDFNEGSLAKVVREASNNPHRPYFVLLDEMNLARVEYYFSDILSIMESRKKDGDTYISSTLIEIEDEKLTLPNNLYIIGTVNMDETTHPFSKKVLDRANTIEFNEIHLANFSFLANKEAVESIQLANSSIEASYVQLKDCYEKNEEIIRHVSNELTTINKIIEPLNAHVGYRVRDEICFYMIYNNEGSLFERDEAFDYCLMQKILPRIAGSGLKIRTVLEKLFELFTGNLYTDNDSFNMRAIRYPLSAKKVHDMLGRLGDEGFTSFWIS